MGSEVGKVNWQPRRGGIRRLDVANTLGTGCRPWRGCLEFYGAIAVPRLRSCEKIDFGAVIHNVIR
jgi:hypothetical protein